MTEMSVTQGLAELKLLDKRINKGLGYIEWAIVRTKTNKVDEVELERVAKSEYQSYMALVDRRDMIKRAIVLSNATTPVTIGAKSWSGTVAEAIEHKASLKYKKSLLEKIKQNITNVKCEYAKAITALSSRIDTLMSSELSKDIKTNPDTVAALMQGFKEANKVELVDPLDLSKMAKDLEEEIDSFESNVDWVLSESNGKAMIKV